MTRRPKYFTPNKVSAHNTGKDPPGEHLLKSLNYIKLILKLK
jgi:hypothetical protein